MRHGLNVTRPLRYLISIVRTMTYVWITHEEVECIVDLLLWHAPSRSPIFDIYSENYNLHVNHPWGGGMGCWPVAVTRPLRYLISIVRSDLHVNCPWGARMRHGLVAVTRPLRYLISTVRTMTYVWITHEEMECIVDLLLWHAPSDVQEIGRLTAVQFDNVHCGHGKTGTIHCVNRQIHVYTLWNHIFVS